MLQGEPQRRQLGRTPKQQDKRYLLSTNAIWSASASQNNSPTKALARLDAMPAGEVTLSTPVDKMLDYYSQSLMQSHFMDALQRKEPCEAAFVTSVMVMLIYSTISIEE